jgi:hypothetical protein
MDQFLDMLSKASITKDEETDLKSIKIPQFSDGTDWDAVVFELEVNLEKCWKHQNDLDIVDYLNDKRQYCDQNSLIKLINSFIMHLLRRLNAIVSLESRLWLQGTQMQFHKFKETEV